MDHQLHKNFEELFKSVSDREKERNPALRLQTERLRRSLSQINKPSAEAQVHTKTCRRSMLSIAGEYAVLK